MERLHHFHQENSEEPDVIESYPDNTEYVCMRRKKQAKGERKKRERCHQYLLIVVVIISLIILSFLWSRVGRACLNYCINEDNPYGNLAVAIIFTLLLFIIIYWVEVDDLL